MKNPKPTKHSSIVFGQLCNLIPVGMVRRLSIKHGVEQKCRTFSAWSHVVSLLYCQLTHCIGLNDLCDALRHHSAKLFAIRGARAPSRNGLSHANKSRNADMMEELFWKMHEHLQHTFPGFGPSGRYKGLPHRFKRAIYSIDSSVITLVANCIDWAKHRRRKAAAKLHLRLNLQTFLPSFAVVEEGSCHDSVRMIALCAGLQAGEIVVFDKAYVHFKHLLSLTDRGVFWVTRAKENTCYRVCKKRRVSGNIVRDDEITLTGKSSKAAYPSRMRRIVAKVQLDGKEVEMAFLTNNMQWAPSSVCDLYQSRWAIEVFFKQIKQTLQVGDFLGYSKQAIRWQIWSALLMYLLIRFQAWASQWTHSFARIFTMIRGIVWDRFNLFEILTFYGIAGVKWRMQPHPHIAYLPGINWNSYGIASVQ